ncbi:MAG: ATP-binding cassette domain-containing protein [Patescibacteria group bacterium]|jgi:ABC-type sugar transport system ATPase subunit
MILEAKDLTVKISNKKILSQVYFQTENNETLGIVGPSGSGKTTLLRCIAGLNKYEGDIIFDAQIINTVLPEKRNIGLVTQELSLFPHLTIYENIVYPLKVRKKSKQEIKKSADEYLEKFYLRSIKDSLPQEASGGEQQRAALARALIYKPKMLLLDEPFSQLDTILRYELLNWLKNILKQEKILTLFVTHDIKEASFISQRLLVLDQGQKLAMGTMAELKQNGHPVIQSLLTKTL